MREEDEDDCYDEEQDQIQPLGENVNSGVKNQQPPNTNASPYVAVAEQISSGIPSIPKPKPTIKQPAGKFDPSPWNEFFDQTEKINDQIPIYYAGTQGHVFFCLHGAGHSALSFAALAQILKGPEFNSTCVSFDFRGHGGHYCDDETNLSQ